MDIAVIGIGMHPFGRHPGRSRREQGAAAVRAALTDAGLEWRDIQIAFSGSSAAGSPDSLVSNLGLTALPFIKSNGCATGGTALLMACIAIRSGAFDLGIAHGFDKHPRAAFNADPEALGLGPWYGEIGLMLTTQFFAMRAQRYLHDWGIPPSALAKVAAKAYRNGALNPNPWRRSPISEEEIAGSAMISHPLTKYMFCSPAEGGVAIILSRGDIAHRYTSTPPRSAGHFRSTPMADASRTASRLEPQVCARCTRCAAAPRPSGCPPGAGEPKDRIHAGLRRSRAPARSCAARKFEEGESMRQEAQVREEKNSFCRFCHAFCGIRVTVEDGRAVKVIGDVDNPLYRGFTCVKGRALPAQHYNPGRLLTSMKRGRDGDHHSIPVEQAMDEIAGRLSDIVAESGPRSVALYQGTYSFMYPAGADLSSAYLSALGSPLKFSSSSIDQPGKGVAKALHGMWNAGPQPFSEADSWLLIGANPTVSTWGASLSTTRSGA